jgi:hypothetical protein
MTTATRFLLHGIRMGVTGPCEVTRGLLRRLSSFKCNDDGPDDIDVILTIGRADHDDVGLGPGRRIYDLQGGEVLYHSETETLTARYQDRVRMTCNLASGRTEYRLASDEEAYRLASHILFTLALIELFRRRDLYNIHAAGLCRGNYAVILAGPSGAGKSTLTLAMSQAGWGYMGDDMVFLAPGSCDVFGFPEGIDYFPDGRATSRKAHVRPDLAFGSAEVLQARPQALIFPRIAHKKETVLQPVSQTEAFLELAPNVLLSDRAACEKHFKVLEDLTRRVPAFRLHTGQDLAQAGRMIHDVLG